MIFLTVRINKKRPSKTILVHSVWPYRANVFIQITLRVDHYGRFVGGFVFKIVLRGLLVGCDQRATKISEGFRLFRKAFVSYQMGHVSPGLIRARDTCKVH